MDTTKYGKYIISDARLPHNKEDWEATYNPKEETRVLYLGDDIIKGAFYVSCGWFWPEMVKSDSSNRSTKPHCHDYDEVVAVIGTNPDDPRDLGGELEFYLGGERHVVTKTSLIFIPAGLEHGPFNQLKMERPIFQFDCSMSGKHTGTSVPK